MKKIMFSDKYGLTDAVLKGSKTQTRRLVDNRMTEYDINAYMRGYHDVAYGLSPFKIGEVVAIAQSYKNIACSRTWINSEHMGISVKYAMSLKGWTNKMFVKAELMPHLIKITDIHVERLQDISERDCIKEGVHRGQIIPPHTYATFMDEKDIYYPFRDIDPYNWHYDYKKAFAVLIDKVSGKGTWDSNPWVFVYDFELIK